MCNSESEDSRRTVALKLLDCLSSPKDPSDPEYNLSKDMRRERLLRSVDYEVLRVELRARGIESGSAGDKAELLMRILINEIDPSVKISGNTATQLQYVDKTDVDEGRLVIEEKVDQRKPSSISDNPDADDLRVLQTGKDEELLEFSSLSQPIQSKRPLMVMDGLDRNYAGILPFRMRRSREVAIGEDSKLTKSGVFPAHIPAYLVKPSNPYDPTRSNSKDKKLSHCIILATSHDWRNANARRLADEIAFQTQAIVILPDLLRGDLTKAEKELCSNTVSDDLFAAMNHCKLELGASRLCVITTGSIGSLVCRALGDLHAIACQGALEKVDWSDDSKSKEQLLELMKTADSDMNALFRVAPIKAANRAADTLAASDAEQSLFKEEALNAIDSGVDREGNTVDKAEEDLDEFLTKYAKELADEDINGDNTKNELADCDNETSEANETTHVEIFDDHAQKHSHSFALDERVQYLLARASYAKINNLRADFASLSAEDVISLLPRSLVCLDALLLNSSCKILNSTLFLPLYVVNSKVEMASAMSIFSELQARAHTVLDFSFRIYEGSTPGFIINPVTELDFKCRQDAIALASVWSIIFGSHNVNDLIAGAGDTKRSSDAFRVVSVDEMSTVSLLPSAVATYIHDNPKELGF